MRNSTPLADILAIHADLAARNPLHPIPPDSPYAADPASPHDIVLPPAAHEAVVELVKNPPPPTPALVACMARCEALAPEEHAQAGARCEREPHATGNHKVAPRDGLPGAVWSDARSREDGGS